MKVPSQKPPASGPETSRSTGIGSRNGTSGARRPAINPDATASAAARNQAARRSSKPLLDPHGIYGTRTSYRLRAAQRRQTVQTLFALAFLIALAVGLFLWAGRVVPIAPGWTVALPALPSAPSALIGADGGGKNAALLVPTESGSLLAVSGAGGATRRLLAMTFPLRAEPLVAGETVFVPCEDGSLFAIDWRTGQTRWRHHTRSAMTARPVLVRVALPARAAPPVAASVTPAAPSAPSAPPMQQPAAQQPAMRPAVASNSSINAPPPGAPPLGAPLTAAQKVQVETRSVIIAGNDSGEIVALEAGDGRLLWRQAAGAPVGNGLAASGDASSDASASARIFVPLLGGPGVRGGLLCLDARNGRILWGRGRDLIAARLAAPAVGPVAEGGRERIFCGGDDGSVICLDAGSGRIIWKVFAQPLTARKGKMADAARGDATGGDARTDEALLLRGEPLLKTYSWGAQLMLGGNDGGVRCFDVRDGRLRWAFDAGAPVRCRPRSLRLGAEGQAVTGSLSASGGTSAAGVRRAAPPGAPPDAPPDAENGRDLVLVGSDGPAAFALDARTGALVWRFDTQGAAFDTPHLHDSRLLVVTRAGYVQSFPLPR